MKIDIKINEAYLPYLNCAQATQIFLAVRQAASRFYCSKDSYRQFAGR